VVDPLKKPLTKVGIEDKSGSNVTFSNTVSMEYAEAVLDMLNNLEEVNDINEVVQLLIV
jgi:hypothetical protein